MLRVARGQEGVVVNRPPLPAPLPVPPASATDLTAQPRPRRPSGRIALTRSTRVLVADDDPDLRASLVEALVADGFEIVQARDGQELLATLGAALKGDLEPIDLLVSDDCMPGFSGMQVLAGLRAAGCPLPVILVTAFGDTQLREEARRLDAVAVLEKPFDWDDLRLAVLRILPPYLAVQPELRADRATERGVPAQPVGGR